MSDAVTVEIKGLDVLQKQLEGLAENVAKKGIKGALGAGGAVIRDGMVELAPEDTGFLKEHFGMRIKMMSEDLAGSVFIGPEGKVDYPRRGATGVGPQLPGTVTKKGRTVSVASVARYLELGTSKTGKHPFMTQAFESKKGNALDAIIGALKAFIDKAKAT